MCEASVATRIIQKKHDFQLLEELIDAFQLYKKCTVLTRLKSSSAADQASRDCLVVML